MSRDHYKQGRYIQAIGPEEYDITLYDESLDIIALYLKDNKKTMKLKELLEDILLQAKESGWENKYEVSNPRTSDLEPSRSQ